VSGRLSRVSCAASETCNVINGTPTCSGSSGGGGNNETLGAACTSDINHCRGSMLWYCNGQSGIAQQDCSTFHPNGLNTTCIDNHSTVPPCGGSNGADCCASTGTGSNFCTGRSDDKWSGVRGARKRRPARV
jgi:hypothetical protein